MKKWLNRNRFTLYMIGVLIVWAILLDYMAENDMIHTPTINIRVVE